MKKILASLCLILICLSAYAQERGQDWTVDIAPYLWAVKLNGSAGVGDYTVDIDENFSTLLSHINFAGMIFVDVHYKKLGIFLDTVYTKLSNDTHIDGLSANMTNIYAIVTPGLSYEVVNYNVSNNTVFTLEPYVGERITSNNATIKVEDIKADSNQSWVDALIGARFTFKFYRAWTLSVAADIGGTTSSDQNSYNALGLVGYEIPNVVIPISIFGGYRYLHQQYIDDTPGDNFAWDMSIFGPLLGVNMRF